MLNSCNGNQSIGLIKQRNSPNPSQVLQTKAREKSSASLLRIIVPKMNSTHKNGSENWSCKTVPLLTTTMFPGHVNKTMYQHVSAPSFLVNNRTEPLTVCTDLVKSSTNNNCLDPSFLLYASSSVASPLSTSSISSSSSTMLDDSLTSLTWLQNLNIMKSATTVNEDIKQASPNSSMLNENDVKAFEDIEPASKLTCLTVDAVPSDAHFTPSASSSPNPSTVFLQQVSFPLSPPISSSSPPAASNTQTKTNKASKRQSVLKTG